MNHASESTVPPRPRSLLSAAAGSVAYAISFFAGVFVASILGICTRPDGQYASFWPTNALILATMVRWPQTCRPASWIGALAGYLSADLLTGNDWITTSWLTVANMAGVAVGVALFFSLERGDQLLQRPVSMLYLLAIVSASSFSSAFVGGGNALLQSDLTWLVGFSYWATTEFVNYLLILTLVLTTPIRSEFFNGIETIWRQTKSNIFFHCPIAALLIAAYLNVTIGGPGAIVFVVPGLLWCSLIYPRFTTAFITMLTLAWLMMTGSATISQNASSTQSIIHDTMSLQLGVSLMALVPLMVSCVEQARSQLIAKLSHAVKFDFLTGALARKYFLESSALIIEADISSGEDRHLTCMMLDIDHFKCINDNHGHAGGDDVLRSFSEIIRNLLRKSDVFGRLGGEEFALFMSNSPDNVARSVAERIRANIESTPIELPDGTQVSTTVSIGVVCCSTKDRASIEQMLQIADQALYMAKTSGRNRVHITSMQSPQAQGHLAKSPMGLPSPT